MSNFLKFSYDVVIFRGDKQIHVDWGNAPGWIDKYREDLDNADRIWLIPKGDNKLLRNVSVNLEGDKQWILFSRVFGSTAAGLDAQVRVYAIGWKEKVNGVVRKSITWIYPSGEIEVAEKPSYAKVFIDMLMREKK